MDDIELGERVYLELSLSKAIETDEHGNWIIEAEASNENLDFDGQVVLQRALLGSKEYFLANGVISYDHRHLRPDPEDPNWSPEKYIIGEPIDVWSEGDRTFVKAKLYKSNSIAREIVKKLKDGSTRLKTSVGGKRPEVVSGWDSRIGQAIEKVVKVLWDELAITFKPVNQTLGPVALSSAAFVKSLQAGFGTDSSAMTGGRAMIPSDLDGGKRRKPDVYAVVMALAYGDVSDEDEAEQLLKNRGCSPEEAKAILRDVLSKKDKFKEEVLMKDPELEKAFDESIATLEKSMKNPPKKGKAEAEGEEETDKGFPELPPEEAVEANDDEDDLGGEGEGETTEEPAKAPAKAPKKGMQKSLYDEMRESSADFLDVTPYLDNLTKSISKRMAALEKSVTEMVTFQKSMGGALVNTGKLVKSLADAPAPRQAVVNKQERSFVGSDGKQTSMTRQEIIQKSMQAVHDGKMTAQDAAVIEERLNKGMPLSDGTLRLIKSM